MRVSVNIARSVDFLMHRQTLTETWSFARYKHFGYTSLSTNWLGFLQYYCHAATHIHSLLARSSAWVRFRRSACAYR